MDYTTQRIGLKLRKAARYVRLYGPSRTWIKIRGQYHMKRSYSALPKVPDPPPSGGHVGILGCGNFAYSNIAYYLKKHHGNVIRAAMDIEPARAASLYETYGLRYYSDDPQRVLEDSEIDLIFVASNHATHAEYAIEALRRGKSVHIEKPHVVSADQLQRLVRAMSTSSGRVALGFNRPASRFGEMIKRHLDTQTGPAMFNWFLAGHELPEDHWYWRPEEGGRVLGNLCHWTDFIYWMSDERKRYPITIRPTRWEKSDCDIAVNYVFGDGTIAALTFSAKGHTFEGVRETFSAHRGNVLVSLEDFQRVTVECVERKHKLRSLFRDHGHERRIRDSYALVRPLDRRAAGCSTRYVWETAELFLKTREALDAGREVTVEAFDEGRLET
jgi:predicted dehydrogenase